MMSWDDGGWASNGLGFVVMMAGMLVFWGLVVTALFLVVRQLGSQVRDADDPAPAQPTAEVVLAERFARGEIDEDEFRSRWAALHSQLRA